MKYVYDHPESLGFGEHHATEHGRELPAEMRDLDMPHGTHFTEVTDGEAV